MEIICIGLIKKSFHHDIFPAELKLVWICPIFKSGDSLKHTNFNPIPFLTFPKYISYECIIM